MESVNEKPEQPVAGFLFEVELDTTGEDRQIPASQAGRECFSAPVSLNFKKIEVG